ncbi:MAG: TonB-dependent receptor, partial [Aquificaceae bacterium]
MWIGRGSGTSATAFRIGPNWYIAYRESYNYTDRPGFTTDLSFNTSFGNLTVGYWYERAELKQWQPSFPVRVNPDGSFELRTNTSGTPSFRYNYIQKTITTTNTPYLFYEKEDLFNRVDINLGLRYAQIKRDFTNYNTANMPYFPEDGIFDFPGLTKNPKLSYEKTYRKLLFNFGVG